VFEGIDGAGKTTQAKMLCSALERAGKPAIYTWEPTNGPAGSRIRNAKVRLPPSTEAALFTEDRREHVEKVVLPALYSGIWIVCDRYVHSSVAYQGARGVDINALIADNSSFAPAPDLVILLTIPLALARARIDARGKALRTPFETEAALCDVDAFYRSFEDPIIRRLKGTGDGEAVHKAVWSIVEAEPRKT
jgi:dTMP kinase